MDYFYISFFLFVIGGIFMYWAKKRQFDRTSHFEPKFHSFGQKLRIEAMDGIIRGIGYLFIFFGSGVLLMMILTDNTIVGWLAMIPIVIAASHYSKKKI